MGIHLCAIQNNLAISLASVGDRGEAIELLKEAFPIADAAKNDDLRARTLNNFGMVYEILADWPQAIGWLEKALAIAKSSKNLPVEAVIETNIALYHSADGSPQKSLESK